MLYLSLWSYHHPSPFLESQMLHIQSQSCNDSAVSSHSHCTSTSSISLTDSLYTSTSALYIPKEQALFCLDNVIDNVFNTWNWNNQFLFPTLTNNTIYENLFRMISRHLSALVFVPQNKHFPKLNVNSSAHLLLGISWVHFPIPCKLTWSGHTCINTFLYRCVRADHTCMLQHTYISLHFWTLPLLFL